MSKPALNTVRTQREPTTELDTTPVKRAYLTEDEVERLIRAAANERDRCTILMAYTHGLRVTELTGLQWRQLDLDAGHIRVLRAKMSADSAHPLRGREIRMLRKARRDQPVGSRFVFVTVRGAPMTRNGFYKLLEKAGKAAGIEDTFCGTAVGSSSSTRAWIPFRWRPTSGTPTCRTQSDTRG